MGRGKAKFSETIRVRVPADLVARIERILLIETHKDQSDFVRNAIAEYVTREEARLGLERPVPKNDSAKRSPAKPKAKV